MRENNKGQGMGRGLGKDLIGGAMLEFENGAEDPAG